MTEPTAVELDPEAPRGDAGASGSSAAPRRKAWRPEADDEVAALLRRLALTPWLVGGRDDATIAAVKRNQPALRAALARLGWVLVVERDLVRLRKSPPPRPGTWAQRGPRPAEASWFFLLVAAAESMPPRVSIGQLVSAARAAAAEAGLPSRNDIGERRAIVTALRMLDERGVIERLDGELEGYLTDEQAPVLLAVHHTRLAHVVANPGTLDPSADPAAWLAQVHRQPDAARRMRRALIDDTCVHAAILDDAEAAWLSQRVRGDDGAPLARAFGLTLERRAEGAAFVVPEDSFRHQRELGPVPFPVPGTVPHAALLLVDHAAIHGIIGGPGTGWRGMTTGQVIGALAGFATDNAAGKGGWGAEYTEDAALLAERVAELLTGANLLLIKHETAPGADLEAGAPPEAPERPGVATWWFAPVTGRWAEEGSAAPNAGRHRRRAAARSAPPAAHRNGTVPAAEPDLFEALGDTTDVTGRDWS